MVLSEYSLLPLSHVETHHFKKTMVEVKAEGCSPPELSDAYECLGLSQLLDGDYTEAATNLECACTIQEETHKGVNDEKHEHRLRTKFWCGVAFMRIGQLLKAEACYTFVVQHVKRKKWDIYAAANSNLAIVMVQLNKRKDLTIKAARAGVDAAQRFYRSESAPEYYHHLRALLYVLMNYQEYAQVEAHLEEAKGFPALERALYLAGMAYVKGRQDDAADVLNDAINSVEQAGAAADDRDTAHRWSQSLAATTATTGSPSVDLRALLTARGAPPAKVDYVRTATDVHALVCYALVS